VPLLFNLNRNADDRMELFASWELNDFVTLVRNRGADVVVSLDSPFADQALIGRAQEIAGDSDVWSVQSDGANEGSVLPLRPQQGDFLALYATVGNEASYDTEFDNPDGGTTVYGAFTFQYAQALQSGDVTTARALDLIRDAKHKGLPVSCGITPAHLFLADSAVTGFRTFARLSPPLRDEADRQACLAAIADGTIDLICSGHDPHGPEAKRLPFADAEAGMAGAETLLALSLALVRDGQIGFARLFDLLAGAPARLFDLPGGTLSVGAEADLLILDSEAPWRIESDRMAATAGNTPFDGLPVQGRVVRTIKGGLPIL
jgi:hypothetical protein